MASLVSSMDPSYEYNAPQFVDFEQLGSAVEDDVEDYFNYDHENGKPVFAEGFDQGIAGEEEFLSSNKTPKGSKKNTPKRTTPRRSQPLVAKENMVPPGQAQEMKPGKKSSENMPNIKPVLSNLCTDLNAWRNKTAAQKTAKARRKSLRKSGQKPKGPEGVRLSHESPVMKKHKRSASINESSKRSTPNRRSVPTSGHIQRSVERKHTRSVSGSNQSLNKKHTRTVSGSHQSLERKHTRSMSGATDAHGSTTALTNNRARQHSRTTSASSTTMGPPAAATTRGRQHNRTTSASSSMNMGPPQATRASSQPSNSLRSHKRTASVDNLSSTTKVRSNSASRKNTSFDSQPQQKPAVKLTMPCTPSFMRRKPMGTEKPQMTTEEMEIARIKEMRKELERKRKIAEQSHKQAQMSHSYVPKHSSIKPTKPHEFNFATDTRIKEHGMETRQDTVSKDFTAQLRHTSPQHSTQKPSGPTKPQPFNFHERKRKRTIEEEQRCYQFQSMAQKLVAFSHKTPDRFRTKPKNNNDTLVHREGEKPKLTVPHTPNLLCRKRTRPTGVKSQAEIEEEEAEQIKKYKFHAQPLNENILKKQLGVKKVQPKELTKPVEFDMETDRRLQTRSVTNKSMDQEDTSQNVPRANPVPHVGIPFRPKYNHKHTEPTPFSFDEKDRERFAKKEEKIRQTLHEERKMASEFRANPMPDLSPVLPSKKAAPPTMPEPFNLASECRGQQKVEEWNNRIKEEIRQQRAAANFHARPNTVVHKKPFVPQKSDKPLTGLDDVELETERRAEKRAEFEAIRHEHEAQAEAQRRADERLREEQERLEWEKARAAAVHRALPIKKFKSIEVKPSDKPLTQPMTPRFSTRLRSRVDH